MSFTALTLNFIFEPAVKFVNVTLVLVGEAVDVVPEFASVIM